MNNPSAGKISLVIHNHKLQNAFISALSPAHLISTQHKLHFSPFFQRFCIVFCFICAGENLRPKNERAFGICDRTHPPSPSSLWATGKGKEKLVCIKIYLILRIYVFLLSFSFFFFLSQLFHRERKFFRLLFSADEVFMEPLLRIPNIYTRKGHRRGEDESYEGEIDKFPSAKLTITPKSSAAWELPPFSPSPDL